MDASYYRSVEIDKISASLSKAQGAYKPLIPDTDSAHGRFASLRAILDAVRDALDKNALAFHQHIEILDEGTGASLLVTTLSHESGQHIGSVGRIIAGKTTRRSGNLIEIHARIHAKLVLGIAPSENDPVCFDDDGEEIAHEVLIETVRKGKKPETVIDREDTISKEQHDELLIELDCEEGPDILRDIYSCYNIETLADLPREEYHKARSRILKIKRVNEEYRNGRSR
jgi:hypothetical protein